MIDSMKPRSLQSRLKPPALGPGDTIGIVAPASNIQRSLLETGCFALQNMGYRLAYSESIFEQDLYFAGNLQRRVSELEQMFVRDDVKAILCARGGYGSNYLLGKVNLEIIAQHPKIFMGYSDITSLLTWFTDATGLVTFHGPMVTKDFHAEGIHAASWHNALSACSQWELRFSGQARVKALLEGSGEGFMYGGCLSMLAASLGTDYEIQTAGKILFIEDLATKPYQIDRMLMQLKLAGKFEGVQGIIFGEMVDCFQTAQQGYSLEEVILRVLGDLEVPIAFGFHSGHVTGGNITLPLGVRAALQVTGTEVSLRFLESATIPMAVPSRTRV
jgi:muramoyltetrapeptide carboxypeptidase